MLVGISSIPATGHKPQTIDITEISDVWPQLPSDGQLHVYVSLLAHVTGEYFPCLCLSSGHLMNTRTSSMG